ncbi:MAG: hypothetical protein KDK41_02630 [Leptospiraceae bacterium]|nr:hypothetical protein [Leptospiraceae bacterium]
MKRQLHRVLLYTVVSGILVPCSSLVWAETGFPKADMRGDYTENFSSRGLKVQIRTEKSRYLTSENPVLNVTMHNEGFYPLTIFLHENIANNLTIVARDTDGKSLPVIDPEEKKPLADHKDSFYTRYTGNDYHSRALILQPGESYTNAVHLWDYVRQPEPMQHVLDISAYFYPNPKQAPSLFAASDNSVRVFFDTSRPHASRFKGLQESTTESSIPGLVQPLMIDPRETVYLMLSAEYTRNWSGYFKFISLNELLRDYPEFAREYMSVHESRRGIILDRFKEYLMTGGTPKLLRFKVLSEGYTQPEENASTARVQVKATRELEGFRREFLYTYYLTRENQFWKISGVESQLLQ